MRESGRRRREKKRRSIKKFWGDGVPAFAVKQRHLETFMSALTESGAGPTVTSQEFTQTPTPNNHT